MATYMVAIRTSISQQVYFVTREVKCICIIKVIRREKGKINRFSVQTMCGESQLWEEEMCTGDGWNCGEKKNSIVTDVLVEAIFICGKTLYIILFC